MKVWFICLIILTFAGHKLALAQTTKVKSVAAPMQASLSLYRDQRQFSTLNITIAKSKLPGHFAIWGFTDLHSSPKATNTDSFDRVFSEYRLSNNFVGKILGVPLLALELEYNNLIPQNMSLYRYGLTYKVILPMGWIKLRGFPGASSSNSRQAGIAYFLKLSSLSLSGFLDLNLTKSNGHKRVTENELEFEYQKNLSFLIEHRYSEFEESSPDLKGHSFAIGIKVR